MRVLVTGVGRYLGAHLAARLAAHPWVEQVTGFDSAAPPSPLREMLDEHQVSVVTGEARDVAVALARGGVDTVAHMGIISTPGPGGRAAMKEQNIIGTMQLLAACQVTPGVHKVVVRSSTAAYGASFRDPGVFTEATPPSLAPRGGFAKDVIEIEGYVRGFARRRPDVVTTVMRLAPMVGPQADTTLTRYFSLPVVPTVLGRDPRLQFIHLDDALELLVRAVVENHRGTYNVAGEGVLVLSQAIRRAGRVAVPIIEPGLGALAALVRTLRLGEFSHDQLDLLVHGRVVDTRALVEEFGVRPRSTAEAFEDFVRGRGLHRPSFAALRPDAVEAAERTIIEGIRRLGERVGRPPRQSRVEVNR